MKAAQDIYTWVVLNQTQTPEFQRMLENLSSELGPCLLVTGTPHQIREGRLTIRKRTTYDRSSLARRAFTWSRFTAESLIELWRAPRGVFVFALTNPPMLPQVAWLLHKLRGLPYGLLIYDIYPDHLVSIGWLRKRGLLDRLWTSLNRRTMSRAQVVITLGERMAKTLQAQSGDKSPSHSIEVIPNWADTDWLRPIPKAENPFACQLDQVDKVTVLYSGNMGNTHNVNVIVEAARRVEHNSQVSFLLIGDGAGRQEIEKQTERYALGNLRLLPYQPWEILPYSLATGDIAVITQAPDSERLSMPSKTYSMLAAGCAVIACTDTDSDLADLVLKNEVGLVCPPQNDAALAEAITTLASDRRFLEACRARARSAALTNYNSQVVFGRYREILALCIPKIEATNLHEQTQSRGIPRMSWCKRALDLALASVALILLSPLIGVIALLVKVKLGSPVLFHQQRPGLRGQPFRLYKFRTMTNSRDAQGNLMPDAERLTPLGSFLRSASLDELPELWNVLAGHMSLVGPRPLLMQYLDRYTPEQARRHEVRPGITGWAQVNGRNALTWEQKFAMDVWYVDHLSLWLDLKIMALTAWKILKREGINQPGEATASEFMGSQP